MTEVVLPSVPGDEGEPVYRFLVIDSGPIIKLTGVDTLWRRARELYTVPAVLAEVRDAQARRHLAALPVPLRARAPSAQALRAVTDFSRLTGDHPSLSATDLQVLALAYDLECEACGGDMGHIRTQPKRMVGLGPIRQLSGTAREASVAPALEEGPNSTLAQVDDDEETLQDEEESDSDESSGKEDEDEEDGNDNTGDNRRGERKPSLWSTIVDPNAGPATIEHSTKDFEAPMAKLVLHDCGEAGQFDDAEDDIAATPSIHPSPDNLTVEQELELDFPSLAAAATVPDPNADDSVPGSLDGASLLERQLRHEEDRKKASLQPISKSGKLYNSFTKYSDLVKPAPSNKTKENSEIKSMVTPLSAPEATSDSIDANEKSRIIGGMAFAGQDDFVEDDGEGWITSVKEISTMKASGALDPMRSNSVNNAQEGANSTRALGPPPSERAACATTDFAMQNVLLQMNLELLSVDGVKVRKLKSWVTRCGSCYKIFTSTDNLGPLKSKRLFCSHCGSDFLQRIACSVNGKTGRLKLHFSKRHKNNLRGTKFSLPKPLSGNRFQGDLLLREDQLMVGAWNQKVKMLSGGKSRDSAQSIFGKDIASNVGCKASAVSGDDIRVGFGRRNPNAAKGRERRGKRKKTTDKACGLRRY